MIRSHYVELDKRKRSNFGNHLNFTAEWLSLDSLLRASSRSGDGVPEEQFPTIYTDYNLQIIIFTGIYSSEVCRRRFTEI